MARSDGWVGHIRGDPKPAEMGRGALPRQFPAQKSSNIGDSEAVGPT